MPVIETQRTWTFTSSGVGAAHDCRGYAEQLSFYCEAIAGSSGTLNIQTARASSGVWIDIGSTASLNSNASLLQFNGPLLWVRPYVTEMPSTATITVELVGN